MANSNLFEEALSTFRNISNSKVGVLQCETSYPAAPENANLSLISVLNDLYGVVPGYSDHTIGNECVIAAVALGAKIIEKHISIDKEEIDGFFSSTPEEFRSMVRAIRNVELALGLREFRDEIPSEGVVSLRSIYPAQEIKEGEIFTEDNLRIVRPGLSLSPKYLKETLGRVAKRNLGIGDRLFLDDIM
jgi:pseudaminic acid synthase